MILEEDKSPNMEVLYPSNLAFLSMFLKNPQSEQTDILRKDTAKGEKSECADVLTCGSCQKDFLLADILRFIEHKVHCQGTAGRSVQDDEDENSPQKLFKKSFNGDVADNEALSPKSPLRSPIKEEETDDVKGEEKRKREDDDDPPTRKKARSVQDAEANTVDSEPAKYTCGTCGSILSSAWSLVQHVQTSHGIIIYQEASGSSTAPSTPPGVPKPSHSSPLASVSSTATTASTPIPHIPLPLLDPSKVDLSKVDLSKIVSPSSSVATPIPPHPSVATPLLDPSHPFNLLRMPLDGRTPFPSGLAPPFVRPGHDFRMDQLFHESLRMNHSLLPPGFDRQPFLDPGLGASRPPAPTPLNTGGDPSLEFYSHRLRQLAGTTSPTSSTSPKKSHTTPPFSSPTALGSSTPSIHQTPTSSRNDNSFTNLEKPHKCESCGKRFKWEANLVIHSRIHSSESDLKCPTCDEVLTSIPCLRSHLISHRKEGSLSGTSPDSSRPLNEDDNDNENEEEEDVELNEMEKETTPSIDESIADDDELRNQDDADEEGPEDLSTSKSSSGDSLVTSQNVSSSSSTDKDRLHSDQTKSVVTELMDKFGLANLSTYSEAYQQALKESGRFFPHHIGRESTKLSPSSNGFEKTLKLREDLTTKGIMGSQPSLDLAHQTLLGAFDNPFEAQKRFAAATRDNSNLYAGLWLPSLSGASTNSRELFSGVPHSDSSFIQRKLADGSIKHNDSPISLTKSCSNSANSTSLSIVPPTKKERGRNDTCEYCGKIFKNCSNLTVHRRSHTGEKPYKCDLCSYACAQSSKLTRHMKTHGRIGKDVYRCRFCDMPFSVASTLEKHMRKCVVNQNSKGLFPPISASSHDGLDTYKGFHLTSVISTDDSPKTTNLFSSHFNTSSAPISSNDDGDSNISAS